MTIVQIIPHLYHGQVLFLSRCLKSIKATQKPSSTRIVTVIYVNAFPGGKSTVSFEKKLKKLLPNLHFLYSPLNKGFTGAINEACEYARNRWQPDWDLILNDDTELAANFYEHMLPLLKTKKYEAISCVVLKKSGEIESRGLRYGRSGLAFPRTNQAKVINPEQTYLCGTCFFVSQKIIEERMKLFWGSLLNPLFFAYHEDLELSLWIQAHYPSSIYISDQALVTHYGSQTAGRGSAFQLLLGYRNALATVLIYWPTTTIIKNMAPLLFGQLYIIALSFKKGYWLLYPKLGRYLWRHRQELLFIRHRLELNA